MPYSSAAAAAQCRTGVHYMKHQHLTELALNGLVRTLIELNWNSSLENLWILMTMLVEFTEARAD